MAEVELFHIRELDPTTFQSERNRVLGFIRRSIPFASVMEVGSTAVEGVLGKQDLDFVARVPPERFKEARRIFDTHFQRNEHQLSNEEYQGYLVSSSLDVAIQLIVSNGKFDHFEEFLELLRRDPKIRHDYNSLKAAWDGRSMEKYRTAKQAFITAALNNKKRRAPI